jgi:hypothetical protein
VHNVDPEFCAPPLVRRIVNPGVLTIITRTTVRVQVAAPIAAPLAVPSGVRSAIIEADDGAVSGATLPVTGADSDDNLTIAWALMGAGVFLMLVAALVPRRRAIG